MRGRTARRKLFARYRRRVTRGKPLQAHLDVAYSVAALVHEQREIDRRIVKRNARFNRVARRAGFVVPAHWESR